jgi:hypothetical protein
MKNKNEEKPAAEVEMSADAKKRRKLLGAIAAGGAAANLLPSKWSKPVVESVLLPAHAQLSPAAALSTFACTATGYLFFSPTSSQSGRTFPSTTLSFSGNDSASAADFTYAAVTGTVSAVATYTASARAYYTVLSSAGTQFVPYIFDTTCAG